MQANKVIISMYGNANIPCPNCVFLNHVSKMNAAENRNAILKASNATFVTFMDCDDKMHPKRTKIMFDAMKDRDIAWHSYDKYKM